MRQSVKMCVWLGQPDCYRTQKAGGTYPKPCQRNTGLTTPFAPGQVAEPIGTAPSPEQPTNGAARHRSICSQYQTVLSQAVRNITLLQPLTTWLHGGAGTFYRPMASCSILFVEAARCWWPVWITGHRE